MYPLAVEKDLERLWESEFLAFAEDYHKKSIRLIHRFREETVTDSGSVIRFDSELFRFLEELKESSGVIKTKAFLVKLRNQYQALSAFSRQVVSTGIRKKYDIVEPINLKRSKAITEEVLQEASRQNAELIQSLKQEHQDKLSNIIREGVLQGKTNAELVKSLNKSLGISRRKAMFWGRDQASKFYGKVNQVNQTSAGFPGYIWRSVKDIRVRDPHSALEGTYHKWS